MDQFNSAKAQVHSSDCSPDTPTTGKYLNRLEEKKDEPHIHIAATYNRNMKKRWYQINPKRP